MDHAENFLVDDEIDPALIRAEFVGAFEGQMQRIRAHMVDPPLHRYWRSDEIAWS